MVVDWLDWSRGRPLCTSALFLIFLTPPFLTSALFMLNYTSSIFPQFFYPSPLKSADVPFERPPNASTKSFGAFDKVKCVFINPVDCCLLPKSLTRWGIFQSRGPFEQSLDFFSIFCKRNQINFRFETNSILD